MGALENGWRLALKQLLRYYSNWSAQARTQGLPPTISDPSLFVEGHTALELAAVGGLDHSLSPHRLFTVLPFYRVKPPTRGQDRTCSEVDNM
jgi:hypothetical protein